MKLSLFSLSAVAALAVIMTPATALPTSLAPSAAVTFDQHRVVRIQIQNEQELATLSANDNTLKLDYFTHHKVVGGHVDVRVPPQSFSKFQGLNLKYSTLIENLQSVLDEEKTQNNEYQKTFQAQLNESKRRNSGGNTLSSHIEGADVYAAAPAWFSGYHTYADHQNWLATQIANNPGKVSAFSAGKTYQNRDQAGIKIGSGPNNVVFHGTQHAREWISTMVVE